MRALWPYLRIGVRRQTPNEMELSGSSLCCGKLRFLFFKMGIII